MADPKVEVSLEDTQALPKPAMVGDVVEVEIEKPQDFGAFTQTARQVMHHGSEQEAAR